MSKKTAAKELHDWVKGKIPAAGTDQTKLVLQSQFGHILAEIQKTTLKSEKEQLREAFNKGALYGMLYNPMKSAEEKELDGFEKFYKETYDID